MLVDGVACDVKSSTLDTVTCVTGEAAAVSLDGVSQPGSPGLTQERLDGDGLPTWEQRFDGTVTPYETVLQTAFENNFNQYESTSTISKGWFKAPATGNFRFYISCDDACNFHFDENTPFNAANPVEPTLTEKASRVWPTEWRHYFMIPDASDANQYISDWVSLTEGEFYKIEGYMMETWGDDHFTVSVEYQQADSTGHHHANKEIQIMRVDQTNVEEKFTVEISGSIGGLFQIQFVNPLWVDGDNINHMFWKSEEISDNCSASTLRNEIKGYFSWLWGSDITVTAISYDASGIETTDPSLVYSTTFTVTLLKRINGPSFSAATVLQAVPGATITINMPF